MANINGTMVLVPPPPGYVVDFENPQRQLETQVYTVVAVENVLAFAFLLQRLTISRNYADPASALVVMAWILSSATQAILLVGWHEGVMGVHAWEISLDDYGLYARLILAAPLTYALCTGCAKAALCLFYARLNPNQIFQVGVWSTMFIIVGAYTAIFFSLLFACRPIAASWDPLLLPTAQCINQGGIYIATAVIGITTDVLLIAIPVPTIWGLQMPMKQKVGLTIMFAVGSIRTIVTSIVRLVVLIPALTSMDQPWVIGVGTLWIFIEANLLVICACLPTLRRFFKHVAPRFIGEDSHGPSEKESGSRKFRTWGSMSSRPKRQFDTLMNTIGEDDKDIPLEDKDDRKGLGRRQSTVNVTKVKADNDSEEAILFERSVQVTYENASIHGERDQGHAGRAWAV
ncbi:hypothetical protein FB567DRAFT_484751 [Paraphoma chrysanthemicola]|uniref:Rhodopsin domain-containing protein n=1 Tax=Paraphoma chrysanthemicola TaxID=798071 RepID=A0A8K0W436_9PLEO|nr:hypothetical protein FB567DRAFT_484751 [Paraphoma chrysanthemicola]